MIAGISHCCRAFCRCVCTATGRRAGPREAAEGNAIGRWTEGRMRAMSPSCEAITDASKRDRGPDPAPHSKSTGSNARGGAAQGRIVMHMQGSSGDNTCGKQFQASAATFQNGHRIIAPQNGRERDHRSRFCFRISLDGRAQPQVTAVAYRYRRQGTGDGPFSAPDVYGAARGDGARRGGSPIPRSGQPPGEIGSIWLRSPWLWCWPGEAEAPWGGASRRWEVRG